VSTASLGVPLKRGEPQTNGNGYTAQGYEDVQPGGAMYYTVIFDPSGKAIYASGTIILFIGPFRFESEFEWWPGNQKRGYFKIENVSEKQLLYDGSTIYYSGEDIGPLRYIIANEIGQILQNGFLDKSNKYRSENIQNYGQKLLISVMNDRFSETKNIIQYGE
jgi:hypothetical protein